MSTKLSTGLRNHILATGSLKNALDGGVLRVYAGTEPATADAAIDAVTLLVTISNNGGGTGINFDATPANGVISKNPGETWKGTIVTSGTAAFFRFSSLNDNGSSSTNEKRVQGTVGTIMADLLVSNATFTQGNERVIDAFAIGIPASQ